MNFLARYIRYVVLSSSLVLSGLLYFWHPSIELNQLYGLLALVYLYITLLASPLTQAFPTLPGRGHYLRARRAIGVSAAYFALLHGSLSFFGELGGFQGLAVLNTHDAIAIIFSTTALVILLAMASTSFNRVVSTMGYRRWKLLHRFVYVAAVLIVMHVVLIGEHFQDLSDLIPQIALTALAVLLILEALRVDRYCFTQHKFSLSFKYPVTAIVGLALCGLWLYGFLHPNVHIALGSHEHTLHHHHHDGDDDLLPSPPQFDYLIA